ncbi:hypothetical protein RCC89_08465 [Cytophagaceae bacterium ABcell3]|nr:hypothetical protein RCC89_08465 [Cytophagaceae bacterium ABcell3]
MKHLLTLFIFLGTLSTPFFTFAQVGIGVYPSGSEPGLSFKTSQRTKFFADIRLQDLQYTNFADQQHIKTELLAKRRFNWFDRINFVIGIGPRAEFYGHQDNFFGVVAPIAVEGFPFPFPNAGLFFEVAPYYSSDFNGNFHSGFRTVSGINFFFVSRKDELPPPETP